MSEAVRYAVLWDLDTGPEHDHRALPCGVLIDMDDHVWLRLPGDGWGLKERFDESFDELQPDSSTKTIAAGDPEYFDRVLYSLSRTFAITIPDGTAA